MVKNILLLITGIVITLLVTVAWRPANTPVQHNEADVPEVLLRSYQIQIINEDEAIVYDGIRYVGLIKISTKSQLGRVIYNDNR